MEDVFINSPNNLRIAVLIPCYNEELTIGKVVRDFNAALPKADVYVFDNNSSDLSIRMAREAGANVRQVAMQGKGNVVRRMFADIGADVYVLADGDDTYPAANAPAMVRRLLTENLDMVVGRRVTDEITAYREGHRFGNWLLTECVARLFGRTFTDILSGYRVFSRRFVKSFPALATGFEIETELTVHALELRMPIDEVEIPYKSRPAGSTSKLSTYRDGLRILMTILKMYSHERPLMFFGSIGAALGLIALALAVPLFITYAETGLVPRFPTAILVTGMSLSAFLCFGCGLILDTVTRGRQEMKHLAYLQIASPQLGSNKNIGESG
ncbi:MAG: glycosyltransferase [Betaproteobacteria bacterium]|nr:glycosyltransferase [Betaproteobacteria bacterium]